MPPLQVPPHEPGTIPRADDRGAPRPGSRGRSFRIVALLLGLVVAEGIAITSLLLRSKPPSAFGTGEEIARRFAQQNLIRNAYPDVDFTRIYPGKSLEEIDTLQRECGLLRYVYAPFVEFRHLPQKGRFVEVTPAGYRAGLGPQPWPPDPSDFVVFVFGGSTTFGYGAFNDQTVVACLQRELAARYPALRVQCYNFGSVSYISTQERALFEVLLMRGVVPKAAIFIDGLNDYYYPDGQPQLTPILFRIVTPDLSLPAPSLRTEEEKRHVVDAMLQRYRRNVRLTEAIAAGHGVKVLFIGQPTPFVDFTRNAANYPYDHLSQGHELCSWGYGRFKELAASGVLGPRFVWCGDAFADAQGIMYADGVHYSGGGADVFAKAIAERAAAKGLLP